MLFRQTAVQVKWNGESFNLIGVDYQRDVPLTGSMLPTLSGVESLVRQDMINILLSHNPNAFYRAAGLGVELTLAGHTHGGQINVEIVNHSWSPARFMTAFIAGLYRLPMAQMANPSGDTSSRPAFLYVNRGLGTLGIPARLGSAPEITLLTLRSCIVRAISRPLSQHPALFIRDAFVRMYRASSQSYVWSSLCSELTQMMIGVEIAPPHPFLAAEMPHYRMRAELESGAEQNRSINSRSARRSLSNSTGGVPPPSCATSGRVRTLCGHFIGARRMSHLRIGRGRNRLAGDTFRSPITTR